MTEHIERLLYSPREAAQALSLSLSTIHVLIATRKLAVRRMGRLIRIPRSELVRLSKMDLASIWPKREGKRKAS